MQNLIDAMSQGYQSKNHVQTFLNQFFQIAMELNIVQKNYAQFVKVGEYKQCTRRLQKKKLTILFPSVFSHAFADTVLIMIYTSLHPSEMLSIEIENVQKKDTLLPE